MKVIAIKDATIADISICVNDAYYERAYLKGEVFSVFDYYCDDGNYFLIIYQHRLKMNISVDPNKFMILEEYRHKKLEELGI